MSVSGISNATQVSSGSNYSCAVLDNNTIKCWGQRTDGKLGNGTTGGTGSNDKSTSPVTVTGISDAEQVSAGGSHTCALLTNGGIKCWGDNYHGQLGDGGTIGYYHSDRYTPVTTGNSNGWSSVDAGGSNNTCGILNYYVYCWGSGTYGKNGVGGDSVYSAGDTNTPVQIQRTNNSEYSKIVVGDSHSCGISGRTGLGKLFCWGLNTYGQLAQPAFDTTSDWTGIPTEVSIYASNPTKVNVRDISVSGNHSCAITEDNQTFCWGKPGSSADDYRRTPYQTCAE